MDRESDFLISRFDGAILDAKPWGRGFPEEPQTAESLGYAGALSKALAQLHSLEVIPRCLMPDLLPVLCECLTAHHLQINVSCVGCQSRAELSDAARMWCRGGTLSALHTMQTTRQQGRGPMS